MLKSSAHSLWNQTASESRSDGQVGLPWVSSKEGTISTCSLSSPRARTLCSWGTTESDINSQQLAFLLFFLLSSSLSPRSQFRDFKSLPSEIQRTLILGTALCWKGSFGLPGNAHLHPLLTRQCVWCCSAWVYGQQRLEAACRRAQQRPSLPAKEVGTNLLQGRVMKINE